MRTITLTSGLFDACWEEPSPGWVCLLGLDQEADEKVIFLMETAKAEESRRVAGDHGGVNIVINDEQVVVSAPNGKEGLCDGSPCRLLTSKSSLGAQQLRAWTT